MNTFKYLCRWESNQTQAYNFAIARSSNNNANSLFLTKPSQTNGQTHGGGAVWPAGGASYNTALAWINTGRGM